MKKTYTTKTSQMIMEYVMEKKDESFDAQEVYDYLIDKGLHVNLTTVYRNIEKLSENNVVVKFKPTKSSSSFYRVVDHVNSCHRHLHMQCKICGKIFHLDGDFMDDIDDHVKNRFNFNIDCENSLLTGICYECSKKL